MTPEDMKLLGMADVFIINGGGIESFMEEVAAAYPQLTVIVAGEYLEPLTDGEESNAHTWMSISRYREMVETIAEKLGEADNARRDFYGANAQDYDRKLARLEARQEALAESGRVNVILFHEAFDYVAESYGMRVALTLDFDEERQVSAGEVADVVETIREDGVSLILAEERYGKAMACAVQQETDVTVLYLNPLNRGDYDADSYLEGMADNIALLEAYFGME